MLIKKLYHKNKTEVVVISKPLEMESDMTTCSGMLPQSGSEHSYSFWMYVTQWQMTHDSPKFIFRRQHLSNTLNVAVGDVKNELQIYLTNDAGRISRTSTVGTDDDTTHTLSNLPLQAWNHITLTIWDKTLDLYLNGKLARTFILAEPLQPSEDGSFTIGSLSQDNEQTFHGFLSRFHYFTRVISPHEIYKLYLKGPAKSSDLSSKPNTSRVSLDVSLGQAPTCATAT